MYHTLSPGAIGVRGLNLEKAISAAQRHGFKGVEVWMPEVADRVEKDGIDAVRALFDGVTPGGWFLPDEWRKTEPEWRTALEGLPRLAKIASKLDCRRCVTYIWSCSNDRPFEENRQFHVDRLAPMARALASEGIQLGMEFLGPKTLRNEKPYPFVHTMDGMLELNRDVGANAGLLLDCWHWWSSHSTVAALKKLKPEQVVYVHVSDAPLGIPEDEVIDNVRCLPGETGVIDIAGFLGTLNAIGYDGPVVAEPFKKELDQLPTDDDRLKTVKDSLDLIFRRAGLA